VLIDGRRMPYGGVTSASAAADLNQIPTAMVERVEVLTGGASAVYGSDAVAGVVNFIMKKDFEGIQFDGQYSLYQHNNDFGGPGAVKLRDVIAGRAATNPAQFALPDDNVTDGNGVQGTLIMGVSTEDGRGNITAYASYQDNHEVLQRDRDFSACSLDVNPTVSFACGGSSTAFPGPLHDFGSTQREQRSGRQASGRLTTCRIPIRCRRSTRRSDGNDVPRFNAEPTSTTSARQPLPASRHALQPGRDGSLRAGTVRRPVHPADVHGRSLGRADRARRHLHRRHLDDQLRQPVPVGAAGDDDRLRCSRRRRRRPDGPPALIRTSCRCTSAVVTSKAVVVSRTSTTRRSAA
jgi:outer membrane receptor protein involved in Fe transport